MPIKVVCQCGKRFKVDDSYSRRAGKCPACGAALTVPEPNVWKPTAPPVDKPLWISRRTLATFAVTAIAIVFTVPLYFLSQKAKDAPGQKAALECFDMMLEDAIKWNKELQKGKVTIRTVDAIGDDPRRLPWLWHGFALVQVGKDELAWESLFQFNPTTIDGKVLWVDSGKSALGLKREINVGTGWKREFTERVNRRWEYGIAELMEDASWKSMTKRDQDAAVISLKRTMASELDLSAWELQNILNSTDKQESVGRNQQ
jgi:hypothetical protein